MALLAALSEDGTHHQRGGCASSSVVGSSGQSSSNGRTHEHSHPDHILPNCPEYSSLARVVRVRYDDIGSGGCHVVADCADASGATCSLSHAHARTRLGAIHGTSECSQRARRATHIGSLRSDAWCVSRPEQRKGLLGVGRWELGRYFTFAIRTEGYTRWDSSQLPNCLIYSGPEGRHISRGELPDSLYPCDSRVRYMLNRCRRDPQWCSVTYSFFSVCVINGMIHETAMM